MDETCKNCEERPAASGSWFCGPRCKAEYQAAVDEGEAPDIGSPPSTQHRGQRLPGEARAEIVRLLTEGTPRIEIARRLDVGTTTVTRIADGLGLARCNRRKPSFDAEAVVRLAKLGHGPWRISSLLRCSRDVVRGLLLQAKASGALGAVPKNRAGKPRTMDYQAVQAMLDAGRRVSEIAREQGVWRSTINYAIQRGALRRKVRAPGRLDLRAAQAILDAGRSQKAVARVFGVTAQAVGNAVKRGRLKAKGENE